jgi:hypothetical protein
MNHQDNILYLAQVNSRSCYPKRLEDIDVTLPYFEIKKNDVGRYGFKGFNYELHDNAPRMQLWEQYLTNAILPNIDPSVDVSGYYNIQLHDSYTYLNDKKRYKDVLVFSKFKADKDPVMIPDPYMICNWGNMLNGINDTTSWEDKKEKVIFCGTTTGSRDPLKNERINLCLWAKDKRDWIDSYITKVAQIDPLAIQKSIGGPVFQSITKQHVSLDEQMKYRYHLAVDGNTCKFDVWYYATNNVVMKYASKEMLWYFPLLQNDIHYVDVTKENMKAKFDFFNNNRDHAMMMIYNARKFAQTMFRPIIHQMYTINLFESIATNK